MATKNNRPKRDRRPKEIPNEAKPKVNIFGKLVRNLRRKRRKELATKQNGDEK